jgi:hypothetical protein
VAAPISTNAQVGDIRVDMENSCNCCWWKKKQKPTTPVYVHHDGRVERFDSKKTTDIRRSTRDSHENLNKAISYMARERLIQLSQVWEEAAKRGISINTEMPLMMRTVRDLVDIINDASVSK